jgi:hypothetical protein
VGLPSQLFLVLGEVCFSTTDERSFNEPHKFKTRNSETFSILSVLNKEKVGGAWEILYG